MANNLGLIHDQLGLDPRILSTLAVTKTNRMYLPGGDNSKFGILVSIDMVGFGNSVGRYFSTSGT